MMFRLHRRWLAVGLGIFSLCLTLALRPATATLAAEATTAIVATPQSSNSLDAGRNFYRAGKFAEAITAWQTAAQHYQLQGDQLNQALALSYLSLAHQELTHWEAAQQSISQSLQLLKSAKPAADAILWAQTLNTQASLLLHTGKSETALDTWQQAQKYYEQAGDQPGSLGSQINQAQALQNLGFYRRSRQQLQALTQKLTAQPDSEIKVSGLRALGTALQTMGDTNQSQEVLELSAIIARKINATQDLHAILLSLGKTATDLGEPDVALDYLQQVEQATQNPVEQLQARLALLKLFIDYEKTDRLATLIGNIQQQLAQLPANRSTLYAAINFVATLNQLENPSTVIPLADLTKLLATTVQSAQQIKDAPAEAYALTQWGQLYSRANQLPEARQVTQQSLTIARQLPAEDIIAQAAWQLGRLAKQQGNRSEAIANYTEAVKALQAIRGDLIAVNPDIQFSFRQSVEPVYREMVDLLLDEQPSQAALLQARELIEALQVAELDNFFREACLDKAHQIDQVDPTATVVYPIILPDRLAVILSTAGQPLRYHATAKPQAEVEQTLDNLLTALSPVSDRYQRQQLSQQVYDWLIRPAEAAQAFKDTKTLVFVLDGHLRNIPMAALYDGKQYLIEKYAVTLSPGLQLMGAKALKPGSIGAVIGGISQARAGFAALPAVEAELKDIATLVSSASLLNTQFTSEALADRVKNSQADVVHLATHGQFSSRLEDTFLLTWNGRVNVKELGELLRNRESDPTKAIELLVLSACDTAAGDDRAVLGLAGLAVKSGARSTLATLWPVKDKAAALLMTRFYEQLRQPGNSKAEALRQAQIALIHKTDFHEPFFWSAFVLVGNWQ